MMVTQRPCSQVGAGPSMPTADPPRNMLSCVVRSSSTWSNVNVCGSGCAEMRRVLLPSGWTQQPPRLDSRSLRGRTRTMTLMLSLPGSETVDCSAATHTAAVVPSWANRERRGVAIGVDPARPGPCTAAIFWLLLARWLASLASLPRGVPLSS